MRMYIFLIVSNSLEATKTYPNLKQQEQTIKCAKHANCFIFLHLAHHIIAAIWGVQ